MTGNGLDDALGAITEREIRSMPALWRSIIAPLDQAAARLASSMRAASSIVYLGCGSGYLAGAAAVELLREAGLAASSSVASDYVLRPPLRVPQDDRPLALAISRSGETSETRTALEAFRTRTGGTTVAVTCRPESQLAAAADITIAIPEAGEDAVPQTRSVSAFLLLSQLVAARAAGTDALEEALEEADRIDACAESLWSQLAEAANAERYVLLGGGIGYPLGLEAALKFTEMGRVPAVAWRALEFRHGPLEAVDEHTAVVGPLGGRLDRAERDAVGEAAEHAGLALDVRALMSPLGEGAGPLAQLYALHALALVAARARGRDADAPELIRAFVDDVALEVDDSERAPR